jgi:hypothetical protein
MQHATGTFSIKMIPAEAAPGAAPDDPGRMSIAKRYDGDLEGEGTGEMLGVMSGQSGAYVALERIRGTLAGRAGAFTVVHRGVVDEGRQELSITIVPGSGSNALEGISGTYDLTIEDGVHRYAIAYRLPD